MSNEKTVYCGSGKTQNDKWIKATIKADALEKYIQEYKGNKFLKININIKDEADQYGKDVSISVDTWKPEGQTPAVQNMKAEEPTDLPF
jgi:hypothetical protein